MSKEVLQVKNIVIGFERTLLKNFSFEVKQEETLLLVGDSGCGKSTLIESILGFHALQQGHIYVLGKEVALHSSFVLQQVAWLPQSLPFYQQQVSTVITTILNYKANQHLKYPNLQKEFWQLSQHLALEDAWGKKFSDLSGGEKQKTGLILCALLQRPLWILDEPAASLDAKSTELALEFLQKQKSAKLIVNHSRRLMEYFDNKVFCPKEQDDV